MICYNVVVSGAHSTIIWIVQKFQEQYFFVLQESKQPSVDEMHSENCLIHSNLKKLPSNNNLLGSIEMEARIC